MQSPPPYQISDDSAQHRAVEQEPGQLGPARRDQTEQRNRQPAGAIGRNQLPGAKRRDSAAEKREVVVVDRAGERHQHRNARQRQGEGVKFMSRKTRSDAEAEQRGKAACRNGDVDQAMRQQRLRPALEPRPQRRMQVIEQRRVIEIIGVAGELEALRVEHPHRCQVRPGIAGVLDVRHIGDVSHLVKTGGDALAFRAQHCRENEQAEDDRGDEKICRRGGGQCAGRRIGRGAGHEGHKCTRRG